MSPAQRFGFVVFGAATGVALGSRLGLHPALTFLAALAAGLLGSSLVRSLVRPRPERVELGKEVFSYEHFGKDAQRRSIDIFLGSLYYYSIAGLLIWLLLSSVAMAVALKDPLFLFASANETGAASAEKLRLFYTHAFYVGAGLSILTWMGRWVAEIRRSEMLATLLPLVASLSAGYIQHGFAPIVPLLISLGIGGLFPFITIRKATAMCTHAGLRGRHIMNASM